MTKLDDTTRLQHMLDYSRKACEFTQGKTQADLESDEVLTLAIVRLIEIVGEAAANVSPERRKELSDIPWSEIIGMRNRVVHAYFDVNFNIVWNTVTYNLPSLIAQLEASLG